jgi:hypothetical protein
VPITSRDTFSSNIVGILYHLKGSLLKKNLKTANDKKKLIAIINLSIFYPFTHIFIIDHKGTIFSQNKNSVSECFFFQLQKCSIEIFL